MQLKSGELRASLLNNFRVALQAQLNAVVEQKWPTLEHVFSSKVVTIFGSVSDPKFGSENDHAFASVCAGAHDWTCVFIF